MKTECHPQNGCPSFQDIVQDWPRVQRRWEAWWQCGLYDRVVMCVHAPLDAPRGSMAPQPDLNVFPETQWTDSEYIIRRTLDQIRTTGYMGESLPACWNPISSGHALYFGARPHFSAATVTVDPAPDGPDGYPALEGWQDSPWWQVARGQIKAFAKAGQGRFFVFPFWGNHEGDTLAAVRGFQRFYMDILDHPAWVQAAVRRMSEILDSVHKQLYALAFPAGPGLPGYINCLGCWSPRKTLVFDCDISCNMSAKTFRDIFLQPMVAAMRDFDHRIYHLDGPSALHQLETLLDLAELQAIQWQPGPGIAGIAQWIPLIQKIQSRGKAVYLGCAAAEVERLLQEVRPEGLCIATNCRTEAEARDLIKRVERFT